MKITLVGAPASGKGTFAKVISEYYKIPHISTGDLFRDVLKKDDSLSKHMTTLMPDELVINLVAERISKPDCQRGYILDGFPRNINQAQQFLNINKIDVALYLDVAEDVILLRAKNRRVCSNCKEIYSLNFYNKQDCEKCGGKIVSREEDKNIKDRITTFKEQTLPLVQYYKDKNLLKCLKITQDSNDFEKDIKEGFEKIKKLLGDNFD